MRALIIVGPAMGDARCAANIRGYIPSAATGLRGRWRPDGGHDTEEALGGHGAIVEGGLPSTISHPASSCLCGGGGARRAPAALALFRALVDAEKNYRFTAALLSSMIRH